jgi:hypothetical protein
MCFWILSKSIVAPPCPGPKRLQNEPIYMKEVKSETRRPKSQNASYQKRANSASSKRANASTTGSCTNRHAHRHNVQPSLQRSHDIAHRTLLIEPLRSTIDAETQHNAMQPVAPTAVAYNNVASNAACTLVPSARTHCFADGTTSVHLVPEKKVHSLSRLGNTEMAIGGADALPRSARLIALAHWRHRSPTRRRHDRGTPLYSVLALRPSGLGHGAICTTEGTIPSIHSEGA